MKNTLRAKSQNHSGLKQSALGQRRAGRAAKDSHGAVFGKDEAQRIAVELRQFR